MPPMPPMPPPFLTKLCPEMNTNKAWKLLDVDVLDYKSSSLRKKYLTKCLQVHPDKNKHPNAVSQFQEVQCAYEYLLLRRQCNDDGDEEDDGDDEDCREWEEWCSNGRQPYISSYISYFCDLLKLIETPRLIISALYTKEFESGSMSIFRQLDRNQMVSIHEIIVKYNEFLCISPKILEEMLSIITVNNNNCNNIILTPSLEHLLDAKIYILKIGDKSYSVPLWHHELMYEDDIIVKCIPELPYGMEIDCDNHLHIEISINLEDLLDRTLYTFSIGGKTFNLPICEMQLKRVQIMTLREIGIPVSKFYNLCDDSKRSHIIVKITLQTR